MSAPDRRAMVERPGKDLSVRRQCALVGVARSAVYRPKPVARADDLAVMRRIDELHLELPFYGSRRMTFELNKEGRGVNRKRVRRLMRVMGIEALVPRPGTSKAAPGRKIYPYLLRGLKIVEPNHVWAADVTLQLLLDEAVAVEIVGGLEREEGSHPHNNHRSERLVADIEVVMREAAALVRDDAVVRVLGRVLRQAGLNWTPFVGPRGDGFKV